jgi:hypothetical protein
MSNFASKKDYNDVYMPKNKIGAGHLAIAGKSTTLKLVGTKPWEQTRAEFRDHHGYLTDGRKASLLECVSIRRVQHRWGPSARYELQLFPHYILVGEKFINSQDAVVRALHYHPEDIDCLVHNFGTFGSIHVEPTEFRKILKAQHRRSSKIAKEQGWKKRPFAPEIGDHPLLLYFNGVW